MGCCSRTRRVYVPRTSKPTNSGTTVKQPSNYNTLTSNTNSNPKCSRCGGETQVYQSYRHNGELKTTLKCLSCRSVMLSP